VPAHEPASSFLLATCPVLLLLGADSQRGIAPKGVWLWMSLEILPPMFFSMFNDKPASVPVSHLRGKVAVRKLPGVDFASKVAELTCHRDFSSWGESRARKV